jgi:hypothetical protein
MERDLQNSVYFRLHSQFTICQNPKLFTVPANWNSSLS